ncbi:hypothetical protein IEQ34_001000 [Dendrobium chrysotoxum]|uniref:Uncharacterized protein n=1 Tax=Dendrobium chrysotoxum TaxID=161865 RepID=A0AAV7HP14_DENCH|nr:hypothetical protein IEQ34_001000 [Dendrobium chrysotoxum]
MACIGVFEVVSCDTASANAFSSCTSIEATMQELVSPTTRSILSSIFENWQTKATPSQAHSWHSSPSPSPRPTPLSPSLSWIIKCSSGKSERNYDRWCLLQALVIQDISIN